MPIEVCKENNKNGFKYGNKGRCYTYETNSKRSQAEALKLALKQMQAVHASKKYRKN
jgi:tRNA splicing endonuclease